MSKKFFILWLLPFIVFAHQQERRLIIAVQAQSSWTDTGLEVTEGEDYFFQASGLISLQIGNPDGLCGPDGLDLRTPQQPLPEERLGMLIGKVARLLSMELDPITKEVIRHEEIRLFPIGEAKQVVMPLSGRLYLGINENIIEDNSGEFLVSINKVAKNKEKVRSGTSYSTGNSLRRSRSRN